MIWFVGRSLNEYRNYFENRGDKYGVFVDIHREISESDAQLPTIEVDFTNGETIKNSLPKGLKDIDAVIAVYETYIVGLSIIAEFYNLPAIPKDVAEICTDKLLMREKFARYNSSISPDYAEISSLSDIDEFMKSHRYPVILKPSNLSKSLLVTKNFNYKELVKNYEQTSKIINDIYIKQSVKRKPRILIEEFMEGSVHSVDAFIDKEGHAHILDGVVDYETGYDIGKSENYHFSRRLPSALPQDQQDAIREVAHEGVKALGLKSTPAHIELILTNSGPKLVEIGARVGGYRFRMYGYANGINMIDNAINVAHDKPVAIKPKFHRYSAVIELFPDQEGKFIGIENENSVLKLQTLLIYRVVPELGSYIGLSSGGNKASVIVTLGSENKAKIDKDYAFIRDKVSVLTDS